MTLTEQQQAIKERGVQAQSFLESDFFQRFLLPYIDKERMSEYPTPNETGWEEKYRLAFAKDSVYSSLFTIIKNWVHEGQEIQKYEQSEVDINLA